MPDVYLSRPPGNYEQEEKWLGQPTSEVPTPPVAPLPADASWYPAPKLLQFLSAVQNSKAPGGVSTVGGRPMAVVNKPLQPTSQVIGNAVSAAGDLDVLAFLMGLPPPPTKSATGYNHTPPLRAGKTTK